MSEKIGLSYYHHSLFQSPGGFVGERFRKPRAEAKIYFDYARRGNVSEKKRFRKPRAEAKSIFDYAEARKCHLKSKGLKQSQISISVKKRELYMLSKRHLKFLEIISHRRHFIVIIWYNL